MLGCVSPPTKDPVHVLGDGIVGRRRELEWLREWLDAARHGTGRLVLCAGEPGIGKTRTDELSPREVEVARLVAEGLTNRQIAARLVISERTAQNHVQHILTKLGFATRSQIAAWSVRAGK
jgi:DNA-binding NarL/FixJ family response regulator